MSLGKRLVAPWFVVATVVGSGCSDRVCTTEFVYGLNVIVLNDHTGARICDAAVTARDGSYLENLQPVEWSGAGNCQYQGAGERPGTYTVRAEAAGFAPSTVADVRISDNGCHVEPVNRTLRLVPATPR